jgi:hypothetical protein
VPLNASSDDKRRIGDAAPGGEKNQTTEVVKRRFEMEAVYGRWVWTRQRLVALFLGLASSPCSPAEPAAT